MDGDPPPFSTVIRNTKVGAKVAAKTKFEIKSEKKLFLL
jgi:hypothetical protein